MWNSHFSVAERCVFKLGSMQASEERGRGILVVRGLRAARILRSRCAWMAPSCAWKACPARFSFRREEIYSEDGR